MIRCTCDPTRGQSCRWCDGTASDERELWQAARAQELAAWARERAEGDVAVHGSAGVVRAVPVKHDPAHQRCGWQVIALDGRRLVGDFRYTRALAVWRAQELAGLPVTSDIRGDVA